MPLCGINAFDRPCPHPARPEDPLCVDHARLANCLAARGTPALADLRRVVLRLRESGAWLPEYLRAGQEIRVPEAL